MLKLTITIWITVLHGKLPAEFWLPLLNFWAQYLTLCKNIKKLDIFDIILNSSVASNGGLHVIRL